MVYYFYNLIFQSMHKCTFCNSELEIAGYACEPCGVEWKARFPLPRLARLAPEERQLLEDFLLTGGNVSELAGQRGVSRPTMRNRLQELMDRVAELRDRDNQRIETILGEIREGGTSPEQGARMIEALQHGSP